ncbi:hypothetical protein FQZ97_1142160 [compost metagenome]
MGWSSITARTARVPSTPLFLASVWITSRKVNMPTSSPCSMTASEPMSNSAIVAADWISVSSGWQV